MIKKNGDNHWVIDFGDVIKIIIYITTALAIYFKTVGTLNEAILCNRNNIEKIEERIIQNEKHIKENKSKLEKLFEPISKG